MRWDVGKTFDFGADLDYDPDTDFLSEFFSTSGHSHSFPLPTVHGVQVQGRTAY